MGSTWTEMEKELKASVIPWLRAAGFTGSFPHFRRCSRSRIDLVTFQFDRRGGAYFIEIAQCPSEGIVTHWGMVLPPDSVKTWDVHPRRRMRIYAAAKPGTKGWFRYDSQPPEQLAALTIERLSNPTIWNTLCPIGPADMLHLPPQPRRSYTLWGLLRSWAKI